MNSYSLLPTSSGGPQLYASGWINGLRNRWSSSSSAARLYSAIAVAICFVLLLFPLISSPPGSVYPDGQPPKDFDIHRGSGRLPPGPPSYALDEPIWQERAEQVKEAFIRGFSAYERIAYPHDELRPLTNGTKDEYVLSAFGMASIHTGIYRLNVWAATLVDGIDTMVLMGLYEFSNNSVAHVARMKFNEVRIGYFFRSRRILRITSRLQESSFSRPSYVMSEDCCRPMLLPEKPFF